MTQDEDATTRADEVDGPLGRTPQRQWRLIGVIAGFVVPVVTIATLVIPILADAGQRESSADTLAVREDGTDQSPALAALDSVDLTSEPWGGAIHPGLGFSVDLPVDAPLETFPLDPSGQNGLGCSQAQVDWLAQYRVVPDGGSELIDLRNTANSGGAITIRNVRVEGEFVRQDPARFIFYCDGGGAGTEPDFVVVEVTLGDPSPGIVKYDYRSGSPIPPGTVFSMDLAAGELVQMYLEVETLDPSQDFFGRIVADVVVDGETQQIVLQEGWLWRSVPTIRQFTALWTSSDAFDDYDSEGYGDPGAWELMCVNQTFESGTDWFAGYVSPQSGEYVRCTPQELADRARVAPREF